MAARDKVLLGLTAGYKQLLPRLQTDQHFKTNELVRGFSAQAFARIVTKPLTFKAQGAYIENGYDGLMIGGYAVRSVTDAEKNFVTYTSPEQSFHLDRYPYQWSCVASGIFWRFL
jgi:hypothetical protein